MTTGGISGRNIHAPIFAARPYRSSKNHNPAAIGTYHQPVSWGGEVYFSVEHHYEGAKFAGPDNIDLARTDPWNEVNLQLGYDNGDNWTATLYVNNVFDEIYFERGWENADASDLYGYGLHNTLVWPSKPRFVGFKVEYRF